MARIVRDSEAFGGGVGDDEDEDVTFMETDEVEDGGTVKRNPRMVTRKVFRFRIIHKAILKLISLFYKKV